MEQKTRDLSAYFAPIFKITGGFADNGEKRELVKTIPADLGWQVGDKTVPIRELLLSDAVDTGLIQTAVYDSIVKGACPAQCMRNAFNVWPMPGAAMTVNIGASKGYASEVAEGAEVPRTTEHPTSATITAKKYADRAEISQEMIDDAMVPVIQYQLEAAGLRLENALNRVVLDDLTTETVVIHFDTATTNLGLASLGGAISTMTGANLNGTDLIMCPEYKAVLMREFTPATGYFELGDTVKTGMLGKVFGVNLHLCNAIPTAGEGALFGYAANAEIGAYLIDRSAAGAIGMRQDITTVDYKDPIRDLVGMVVKMRFGYTHFNHSAVCGIEY
jgi:HK97 family phage major capsid protein